VRRSHTKRCRVTKTARLLAITSLIVGLSGCDTIYGISAGKILEVNPDDHCVLEALRRTPGIVQVRTKIVPYAGWLISGPGPSHGSPIRYFSFDIGEAYWPTLMIENYGSDRYHLSNTMIEINRKIPEPVMRKALPIMLEAEHQVAKSCGVPVGDMRHQCDWSECKLPTS